MPFSRFVLNVFLFSLAGLMPVLILFIALSPGFTSALLEGGPALSRFFRQVATNGLPVVFVTNYISFFLFSLSARARSELRDPVIYLLIDLPIRVSVFLVLHVMIYVFSADWFGSFGGSRSTAVGVVAPTLSRAAQFENLSGVYLYATLVSALPLYVTVFDNSERLQPFTSRLPRKAGSMVLSLLWFAFVVLALTAVATMIERWQSQI